MCGSLSAVGLFSFIIWSKHTYHIFNILESKEIHQLEHFSQSKWSISPRGTFTIILDFHLLTVSFCCRTAFLNYKRILWKKKNTLSHLSTTPSWWQCTWRVKPNFGSRHMLFSVLWVAFPKQTAAKASERDLWCLAEPVHNPHKRDCDACCQRVLMHSCWFWGYIVIR